MKLPIRAGAMGKLFDADGKYVGMIKSDADQEQIANAVNSHDALVEALELAKLRIDAMIEEGRCGAPFAKDGLTLINIKAALAAAKGAEQ